jgi:hypothetical protein
MTLGPFDGRRTDNERLLFLTTTTGDTNNDQRPVAPLFLLLSYSSSSFETVGEINNMNLEG